MVDGIGMFVAAAGERLDATGTRSVFVGTVQAVVSDPGFAPKVTVLIGGTEQRTLTSVTQTLGVSIASGSIVGRQVLVVSDSGQWVGVGLLSIGGDSAGPSAATQAALDLKANIASPTFTGPVTLAGTAPVIKALSSSTIDDGWTTSTTTQTVGGVTGCTVNFVWRTTIDWVVEWRVYITVPSPYLGSTQYVSCNCPNVFPFTTVDAPSPVSQGPHGSGIAYAGTSSIPIPIRIDPGSPAQMYFFLTLAVSSTSVLEGSGLFSITKP